MIGGMFDILPGFRDFYPSDCATRNQIFEGWRKVAHRFGFEEFDGPILEPLELFTKKSGEEIVDQLFAFRDKGEREVALRPEMTPSLVRILGRQLATLKLPTKWFNITENFRYERPQKGRLRSFYQFNVDMIGEVSCAAEAELIALAIASFQQFGLTREHFYIRLSDRQLWTLWLNVFGIHEEATQSQMLAIFDKWERRTPDAIQKDLLQVLPQHCAAAEFFEKTEHLRTLHSLEEIRSYFREQNLSAECDQLLQQRFTTWQALLEELQALGCSAFITIDLSVVRGLAYYTGFVFEVFETGNQGRALAGGGRYDHLFEKLTGHAMPAVGFAAGDVTLTDLLQKYAPLPPYHRPLDVVVLFEPTERSIALQQAQRLRQQGFSVEYPLGSAKSLSKQLKKAYASQPTHVIVFTAEASRTGQVQLRTSGATDSQLVPVEKLTEILKSSPLSHKPLFPLKRSIV